MNININEILDKKNNTETINNEIAKITESELFKEFSSMMALEDDKFTLLAPAFILSLQKSLNEANTRIILAQAINSLNLKEEDANDIINTTLAEVDKIEELSQIKKDFLKELAAMILNLISDLKGVSKRIIQIPIELCRSDAKIPTYTHIGDAAADVHAAEDIDLAPGETKIIPTGIKVELPMGYAILVCPRSGLSAKTNLRIANAPGTVDSNYRGELGIIAENIESRIKDIQYAFNDDGSIKVLSILHGSSIHFNKGERIAQIRLVEVPTAAFYQVEKVNENTERGENGFGSSGTK